MTLASDARKHGLFILGLGKSQVLNRLFVRARRRWQALMKVGLVSGICFLGKEETMNHTPTPFRVGRPGTVVSDSADGLTLNGATGPENVKYYGGNLIAESVSEGNAAFISEACNAYDGHVGQALRDLLAMQGCITCQDMLPCDDHGNINETMERAKNLIATT